MKGDNFMYDALMKLMATSLNIVFGVVLCVFLFQFGIKRFWSSYPFSGFKKSFFLFITLLGVYGFIRGLINGW